MKIQELNIAMVYAGDSPHPSHAGFAEAVDADLLSCDSLTDKEATLKNRIWFGLTASNSDIQKYDVMISEGTVPLSTTSVLKAKFDFHHIYLCADHLLLSQFSTTGSQSQSPHKVMSAFESPIVSLLQRTVDSVIAVSKLAAEDWKHIFGDDIPVSIAHPYIESDVYDELKDADPDLRAQKAVTVSSTSQGEDYKGVDILVDSWKSVRQTHPQAELRIVGKGHPEGFDNVKGVHRCGYVSSLSEVFERSSLYVHPARYDTYPVSTLEASLSGLPCILTSYTGTKELIPQNMRELVCKPEQQSLSKAIRNYFNISLSKKESFSEAMRKEGHKHSKEQGLRGFRTAVEEVLEL